MAYSLLTYVINIVDRSRDNFIYNFTSNCLNWIILLLWNCGSLSWRILFRRDMVKLSFWDKKGMVGILVKDSTPFCGFMYQGVICEFWVWITVSLKGSFLSFSTSQVNLRRGWKELKASDIYLMKYQKLKLRWFNIIQTIYYNSLFYDCNDLICFQFASDGEI